MPKTTHILLKPFLAILFWLTTCFVGFSQTFPIYVMPTLTPPHSLVLADYAKPGAQNLVVTLMVNDVTIVNLPVRLHLRIETATGIVIENIPAMNARPIYLNGGQVAVLFGSDLADNFNINNLQFRGISREEYRRTGQIPAGFYRFTVEVRHFITGRLISNQGSIRAWMALGRPPELRNPANEAEMGQIPGAPLVFSWQPAQLGIPGGSVRYLFEMWEMRVPNISPFVYAASMPVFHSETTSQTAISIPPASLFLEPGMKYAWRVTAFDPSGFIPFIENGHSEVRTFVYQSKCDEISNLTINRTGRNVAVRWRGAPNHTSFFMEVENPNTDYRRRFQLFDSRFDLFNVEEGKTYNIRIQAVCGGNENNLSDFTQWHTFTIPERQTAENHCPECACDAQFENVPITNFERREVQPGDTIRLANNSTRFIIKTAEEQPNGAQRGVFLFWWEYFGIKILSNYWDLTVNTDNVILTYDFESVFNPTLLFDIDEIQDFINDLHRNISVGLTNTNIRDTIRVNTSITDIFTDGNGNIVIVDGNGNERILDDDFNRTLIVGENGEEFVVTNNGRVMGVDEFRETGGNRFKQEEANREREANAQPSVFFTKYERQRFGFDSFTEEKIAIQHNYPELQPGYRPPFKSVQSFQTDKVIVSGNNQSTTFRTEWGIPAILRDEKLTVRGGADGEETILYAFNQLNDTTEIVSGKLNVLSFDEQTRKVYLVSVNGISLPDTAQLRRELNRIFAPALVRWQVEIANPVTIDFPEGNMTHGGSGLIGVYNRDQRAVIRAFGNMEREALYLFFVDNVQNRDPAGSFAGYMPLGYQSGFIYGRPNATLVAHELAHGAFNLVHTFSSLDFAAPQNTTNNLMDYRGGDELWVHQWRAIQNPRNMWLRFLQDEEEGQGWIGSRLKIDRSDGYNVAGVEAILSYLIRNRERVVRIASEKGYIYEMDKTSHYRAEEIITEALGGRGIYIGAPEEASYLLRTVIEFSFKEQVLPIFAEMINTSDFSREITESEIRGVVSGTIYMAEITTELIAAIQDYRSVFREFNLQEIARIRDAFHANEILLRADGLSDIFFSQSNQRIKTMLRNSGFTNSEVAQLMELRRNPNARLSAACRAKYNNFLQELNSAGRIREIARTMPDVPFLKAMQKASVTPPNINLSRITRGVGTGLSAIAFAMDIFQPENISPVTILSYIPHPFALLMPVFEHMLMRQNQDMEEGFLNALTWRDIVSNARNNNAINILMYYTDVNDRYNPDLTPTSIVITDAETATRIFGFSPKYVNFDTPDKLIELNGRTVFTVSRQVEFSR